MNDNMNTNNHDFEPTRQQSLLADRATGDIAPEYDGWREPDEYELAAAEAAVAYAELRADPMPDHLRSKLQSIAKQGAWKRNSAPTVAGRISTSSDAELKMPPLPASKQGSMPGSSSVLNAAGWLAAAAAITIAAVGWLRPVTPQSSTTPIATNTSIDDRLASLESAPGTVSAEWIVWPAGTLAPDIEPRPAATEVTGKFVWNEQRQEGYMVFENMPVNDPTLEQYQLWLVSADHEHPIDGGVFDIASTGKVVVPIDAKIRATNVAALGITVEKPDGPAWLIPRHRLASPR